MPMNKTRILYALCSFFAIFAGMMIYLIFRDLNHLIVFEYMPKPDNLKLIHVNLEPSILSNILKFNLPDMLWFLSGIWFLRFLWFNNRKTQKIYVLFYYGVGALFETSQLSEKVPGTFDWFDLLFMGTGAFVEGFLYNTFVKRRMV